MRPGIVQDIFTDHFECLSKSRSLNTRQIHAAENIMTCRTPDQGFHVNACPNGDYQVVLNNSCKNRSCPQCGASETQLWLERRKRQALDCRYFHVIFTISHDLHCIWRKNRKLFTGKMMLSSWHSLRELLADPKWLGCSAGAVAVFQSWDDYLKEHCHVHFIVTAGGLTPDGRWIDAQPDFLLPKSVLAAKFQGKFLAYLKEGFTALTPRGDAKPSEKILEPPDGMSVQKCLNLINRLGRIKWHVKIEPSYPHANAVFMYLGRYIRRGPISEYRIIGYDGQNVKIAFAHPEKHDRKDFSLSAETFVDRILKHVPEKGTHLVRSYGLFHPNCREKLDQARKLLGQPKYVPLTDLPHTFELIKRMFPNAKMLHCPICGAELEIVFVYRRGRTPIWRKAA